MVQENGEADNFRKLIRSDLIRYSPANVGILKFLVGLAFSPGFLATLLQRISAAAYKRGRIGRVVALIVWRLNANLSACYLSQTAKLGPGLFLPHPTGIVIGEGVTIGRNVTIYQSVTLGTQGGTKPEYPVVEDNVVIYPGSVIVGGITIGSGAIVGANSFVSRDVTAGTTVAGAPAQNITRFHSTDDAGK